VSAIYGLGDPASYLEMVLHLVRGERMDQRKLLRRLADMQYTRNEMDLRQGTFRVRGDVVDIFPAEAERDAVRVMDFGIAALLAAGHEVVRVYSQPPRQKGRWQARLPSPVAAFAGERGLAVATPVSLKAEAEAHAAKLMAEKRSTHFVQPVKEPMEDKKEEKK